MEGVELQGSSTPVSDSPDAVLQLLAEGGYHRARIKALSVFDRIAGGLSWGILNSHHRIDVEFVENAAIREKIRASESICEALKSMRCPIDLRPHQIQGLDMESLLLVTVWLLKRVEATRAENALLMEEHTAWDFHRRFGAFLHELTPAPDALDASSSDTGPSPCSLYVPQTSWQTIPLRLATRQFLPDASHRHSASALCGGHLSRLEHAASVLLEYGARYEARDSVLLLQHTAPEEMSEDDPNADVRHLRAEEAEEHRMWEALASRMTTHRERCDGQMSRLGVAAVVRAAGRDAPLASAAHVAEDSADRLAKRRRAALRHRQRADAQRETLAVRREEVENASAALSAARDRAGRRLERTAAAIRRVRAVHQHILHDPAMAAALGRIDALCAERSECMARLEAARQRGRAQMRAGKAACGEIAARVDGAQPRANDTREPNEVESNAEEAAWWAERERWAATLRQRRAELAALEKEALDLLRRTDAYPTRGELHQLECRIRELNSEVATRYEETRAAFTQYNTQAERLQCLESESAIAAQVDGQLAQCFTHPGGGATLAAEQERIALQLREYMDKLQRRREEAAGKLHAARSTYDELLTQQQKHGRLLEMLHAAIEEHSALLAQEREQQAQYQEEEEQLENETA